MSRYDNARSRAKDNDIDGYRDLIDDMAATGQDTEPEHCDGCRHFRQPINRARKGYCDLMNAVTGPDDWCHRWAQ